MLFICLVVVVFPIVYTLSPSVAFLNVMQLISGFVMGGVNLAVFNLVFAYSRPEKSPSATAVFNMLINLASFISPFLGDICYKRFGIHATFYVGAGLRLSALIFLAKLLDISVLTGKRDMGYFNSLKVGSHREGRS